MIAAMPASKIEHLPNVRIGVKPLLGRALEDADDFAAVALIIKHKDGRYGVRYSAMHSEELATMAVVFSRDVGDEIAQEPGAIT